MFRGILRFYLCKYMTLCHALWMIMLKNANTLFSMASPLRSYMTFTQGGGGRDSSDLLSLRPNKSYKTSFYKKFIKLKSVPKIFLDINVFLQIFPV